MTTDYRAYGTLMHPALAYKPEPGQQIVAYVRSGGVSDGDTQDVAAKLYTTLNGALSLCRSGMGDVVVVLPGHDEDISSADQMSNLKAGTTIVGLGFGRLRPRFTWTAATATWLLDVDNVTLVNLDLEMAGDGSGTLAVAAPMTVTGKGCSLIGCRIRNERAATERATIAITLNGAEYFSMYDCYVYGEGTGANVTTAMRITDSDKCVFSRCYFDGQTSSNTVGIVQFLTTASEKVHMSKSFFANRKSGSVHAVTGMAGITGCAENCYFLILDNATAAGFETEGNFSFFDCKTANAVGEQGIEKTPVSV